MQEVSQVQKIQLRSKRFEAARADHELTTNHVATFCVPKLHQLRN